MATKRAGRYRSGFTLIEVLVALVIVSMAATITVKVFAISNDYAERNNRKAIAMELAYSRLAHITAHPELYNWPTPETIQSAEFASVTPRGIDQQFFDLPTTMPTTSHAKGRQVDLYELFQWEAYVSAPEGAAYVDLTVMTRWFLDGKRSTVTITSAVPASVLREANAQ